MFNNFIGEWPKHNRFILTSCDEMYFNEYFPRFYKTYSELWELPIHVHIIDPTKKSRNRLEQLPVSYTYCATDKAVLKFPYSYETYYQAQRFILLGHNLLKGQSIIVADVDSYAIRRPNADHKQLALSDMAFTKFQPPNKFGKRRKKPRLMATFCNFHYSRRSQAKESAIRMQELIEHTDRIGVDQLVLTEIFQNLPYNNLRHGEWIRHYDVKQEWQKKEHNKCLIYHEKGSRGKDKGIKVKWTDIGL